jgi:hypothetical protein
VSIAVLASELHAVLEVSRAVLASELHEERVDLSGKDAIEDEKAEVHDSGWVYGE